MKKYVWILFVIALIAESAFAQMEGLKYEQDFILLPVKDWEYINILVEADIVVTDRAVYNDFFIDKISLLAFLDDIICSRLRHVLAESAPDEIQSRLNDISKDLANKIESRSYKLRPSKRGIKVENIKLTLK